MKKSVLLIVLCFCLANWTFSQVRDVRSNVQKDKSSSSSSSSSRSGSSGPSASAPSFDDDMSFGAFIVSTLGYYTFYAVYKGFYYGQAAILDRRERHPEIVSLQGSLVSGIDAKDNSFVLSPSIRANWGLFGSDLRFVGVKDVTGNMQTIDWQVLLIRLPIANAKFEYGLGFSYFISPSKTYFDQSVGFDWCFFKSKANVFAQYRWSQNSQIGGRYRQESSIEFDYEVVRRGKFRLSPSIGFVHQNYFDVDQFSFMKVGIKVRLF